MARYNGSDLLLYVASSAPSSATDPADAAYEKVGQVIDLDIDSESEEVNVTDRDGQSTLTGSLGYTIPFSFHYEIDGSDAGQELLFTRHLARADVWWLVTNGTSSETCFHGTGQPTSMSVGAPTDEGLVVEGSIGGASAYTKATTA